MMIVIFLVVGGALIALAPMLLTLHRGKFTIFSSKCLRCEKGYDTRHNLFSKLWFFYHRFVCNQKRRND